MKEVGSFLLFASVSCLCCEVAEAGRPFVTTDELENHISPEDLREFLSIYNKSTGYDRTTTKRPQGDEDYESYEATTTHRPVPDAVDCFGLGSMSTWLLNMKPDTSSKVNTHFYFSSRKQPKRVQVYPGDQFGLEWVDFSASRKTVMIVHGFMSHSNASWVIDMTKAFLAWGDLNVIAVDWSGGGNTWKYWRAVANTRRVGSDITDFLRQLVAATGARTKDFHFVGHSLGAHICSYVSYRLGGVSRITGLDPAQPCFRTSDRTERLDDSDADFVDVIHTNGRLLNKIGFGLPDPTGHADFYPNGGMKQPGCFNGTKKSLWNRFMPSSPKKLLQQAICSHGRAYLLFTESLLNNNCTFKAHRWNLTYEGVTTSLTAACDRHASCTEMGINANGRHGVPKAQGAYFVLTTETQPYCPSEQEWHSPRADLLHDLREGFQLDRSKTSNATVSTARPDYADPLATIAAARQETTTQGWWGKWVG
ncbi:lipase domain-containing protein [Phthorimaea operculella]|nr:lipase domain-containing protein [Phthorimaea operculella]